MQEKIFFQKVNLWRDHEGVSRLVRGARLAEVARRLAGATAIRAWHDHALFKPGGEESRASAWHQDLPYWPMNEPGALSCWLALDDVGPTNGCMHFIRRSHLVGRLDPISLTDPQDIFSLVPQEHREAVDPASYVAAMSAGSCAFHNGLTFHYAPPNRSGVVRRAFVVIYMPDGTT